MPDAQSQTEHKPVRDAEMERLRAQIAYLRHALAYADTESMRKRAESAAMEELTQTCILGDWERLCGMGMEQQGRRWRRRQAPRAGRGHYIRGRIFLLLLLLLLLLVPPIVVGVFHALVVAVGLLKASRDARHVDFTQGREPWIVDLRAAHGAAVVPTSALHPFGEAQLVKFVATFDRRGTRKTFETYGARDHFHTI